MTHGIRLTRQQIEILEENNVDFIYYDFDEEFAEDGTIEIEFESNEFDKACELLGIDAYENYDDE